MSSHFNDSRDGMPSADGHQDRPQHQNRPQNIASQYQSNHNTSSFNYNHQQYHVQQQQLQLPPYHRHYSYAVPLPWSHQHASLYSIPQHYTSMPQHYTSIPHQPHNTLWPDYNSSNMTHRQFYNNTSTQHYHTEPDMQHSTTTAAPIQSNNKKQKVEQAAVQAAEPVQSSSIDDIQLSATPLTNERLISMLSSKLINTANNYGDRFTVLELEQVSIEEIGYQSRFNSDESDVVNRLLSKYMPNNESSPNNRPRTEKSTNIKTTDNGWIHESKIYYNKNDRNQKVRIIRATNGRYSALLFCPNQYLFPSLYNKHAREMIINAAPENVMEVLVSSFRSRITSLPNSDSITGTFNELISYYNDVNGEQKAKPNKTTVAKSEIPRSMSCKSKDRYDRDNEEVRTNKSNTSVSSRLEMVATGQYRPDDEELINVIVNTKYRDNNRLIESGIPFGFINDTYKCMLIDKEEYADLPDKIILDNKEEPLSDYTVGKMKYNNNIGPRIIVNKNGYAYLYVDDHFNLERLEEEPRPEANYQRCSIRYY